MVGLLRLSISRCLVPIRSDGSTLLINVKQPDGFWRAEIEKFLDAYARELEMEHVRRKHFGWRGFRGCHSGK